MATIAEHLKKILSARYGKDVRQAIHDGIKQCYDDGRSGSIDLMARNQIEALNESMINMSSEVDDRVKYSEVVDNLESTEADKPLSANQGKALNDALGTADISTIGDGTVKGAIKELDDTRQLTNYINISDIGLDAATVTFADFVEKIPENSMYAHSIWKSSLLNFEFPEGCGDYCYLMIFKGTTAYVNALLMDLNNNRIWNKAKYGGVTTAWNSYLPLTGGTLSGLLWTQNGFGFIGGSASVLQLGANPVANNASNNRNIEIYNRTARTDEATALLLNSGSKGYNIFGEHNKPSGTYTGNGSATSRQVSIGGIGELLYIFGYGHNAIVGSSGGVWWNADGQMGATKGGEVTFANGILYLSNISSAYNASGAVYGYQVL